MSGVVPEPAIYEFGAFRIDAPRRLLTRRGEPVPITGKPFDALVYLLQHAGRAVSRDELASALWPSTVVEDNNLSQTILAIRRVLEDDPDTPRFIATIPRRGYQFVAGVRIVEAPPDVQNAAPATDSRRGHGGVAALVTAVAVIGLGLWYATNSAKTPSGESGRAVAAAGHQASPRSVAVLPFADLGSSPGHEYFAAGLHEEVLNQLGRIRELAVTARTSVTRYAGTKMSVDTIARELGVTTVLEGSVRYADNRVRITVRLADGSTGTEMWTETYDETLGDVFRIQADIATRIASALATELTPAERLSLASAPTRSLAAYTLYLRALALYRTHGGIGVGMPPAVRAEITRYLDDALAADPAFPAALGWRAQVALDSLVFDAVKSADWPRVSAALVQHGEQHALRAVSLDPSQGTGHVALARLDIFRGRFRQARATLERGLARRAGDPVVLFYLSLVATLLDDHGSAMNAARRAIAVDPLNPAPYSMLGTALRASGDLAGARAAHRRMIELAPGAPIGYITLARTETASDDPARLLESLHLAERVLLDTTPNFRADAALSFARAGAHEEAARLIREFERMTSGCYVSPGLAAMARLAVEDYAGARALLQQVLDARPAVMDPMPIVFIRRNSWADPVLERPEWRALRARLAAAN